MDHRSFANPNGNERESPSNENNHLLSTSRTPLPETNGANHGTIVNGRASTQATNGTVPPWRSSRGNHSASNHRRLQLGNNNPSRDTTSNRGHHTTATNGANRPWRSNGIDRRPPMNGTDLPQTANGTNGTNTPATTNGTSRSAATNGKYRPQSSKTSQSTTNNGLNQSPATNGYNDPTSVNSASQSTTSSDAGFFSDPDVWDVMQFRYHHGVNLGGSFVLDKAISPSMFCADCNESELGAVSSAVEKYGILATRARWEKHWRESLTEEDLEWLSNTAKCTTIRIPIGYFTLDKPFVENTPFNRYSLVYVNAWLALKDMVARARNRGIGTLLIFDSIPGGRCEGDYPDGTDDLAERVGMKNHADLIRACLMWIAKEVKAMDGIVGLQLSSRSLIHPANSAWYYETIDMVGMMNDTLPIYLPDDDNLTRCLKNLREREYRLPHPQQSEFYFGADPYIFSNPCSNPIMVDSHFQTSRLSKETLYTQEWRKIMEAVPMKLKEKLANSKASVLDRTAFQVVMGRYSCFLPEERSAGFTNQQQHFFAANCGTMQNKIWQEYTGGAYFWTFKGEMNERLGDAWRFTTQTEINGCNAPAHFFYSVEEVLQRMNSARKGRYTASIASLAYLPPMPREKDSLESQMCIYIIGWDRGFKDAEVFYGMKTSGKLGAQVRGGADKIGCFEAWVRKRVLEFGIRDSHAREFENGIRKGVRDYYRLVDV